MFVDKYASIFSPQMKAIAGFHMRSLKFKLRNYDPVDILL